ncbi:MAG: PIN domain-containing protein [Flavobacteriales bacterium]|nr:PIN domain-containing protein [Flavobacteriales bacterium]MBK6752293.1 PIN domain-containing protein [Flavobacteriales bacterium]MBK9537801.1 PIN domain-containing protein [Flavobacteriales bacterium]
MPPKRIFLDANVLVTVLCNEYPRFSACARVLSLADDKRFEVYTSPLCLAIGAYFAEKKGGKRVAKKKAGLLAEKLKLTTIDASTAKRALANKRVEDLEDGMQYYSALDAKCMCIVTYDKKDFHFADTEVLDGEEFLLKYAVRRP